MRKRHQIAMSIHEAFTAGTSDLLAVIEGLKEAVTECRSESVAPEKDAAVLLILHFQATLLSDPPDAEGYHAALKECREKAQVKK